MKSTRQVRNLQLSDDDLRRIENAVPPEAVAGTRYGEDQMVMLDSERQPT